ncbi:class I SAM-dependent methyltransferase [Rubritalea spongiae]|uniref:Class I SAM-dependent methyltransferase n=1 Tax=Rubritalea spongiae TaxID=430797 RepID=A0ABW5DXE3_9BACT
MTQATQLSASALNFYFQQEEIPNPTGKILVVQGAPGPWLNSIEGSDINVISYIANENSLWTQKGITPVQETSEKYDTIIHFSTKFATENLAQIGKFSQQLKPNGRWMSVIPNRMGASRLKKDISKLFSEVETCSKSKCRIFDTSSEFDAQLARKWASLGRVKAINGTNFRTTPGIFSSEKVDTGSLLLADILKKESFYGSGADLGAAYGFLSKTVLDTPRNRIREIVLYELDKRALDCAQQNLAGHDNALYQWADVTAGTHHVRKFDWVIMNPPFHEAQDQSFELGKTFIREAARILKPGGSLYLVANLHLPYEELIRQEFRSHRLLAEDKGFKCIFARA